MKELSHKEKMFLIISILYRNKNKNLSIDDLLNGLQNRLSKVDIERVLESFWEKGLISEVPVLDADGAELPVSNYRLSSDGVLLYEQTFSKENDLQFSKTEKDENTNELVEYFPRIFKNTSSYLFFLSLKEIVRSRYQLADYSFIFRKMQKEKLINTHVSDKEFRDFINENYNITIETTKTLEYCSTQHKEFSYSQKKKLFNPL